MKNSKREKLNMLKSENEQQKNRSGKRGKRKNPGKSWVSGLQEEQRCFWQAMQP